MTAPKRVLLLDFEDQLTGVHDVDQLFNIEANDFGAIHALCFASGRLSGLLRTTKRKQIDKHLWELSIAKLAGNIEPTEHLTELKDFLGLLEKFNEDIVNQVNAATQAHRQRQEFAVRRDEEDQDGQSPHLSAVERSIALRNRLRNEVELIAADKWKEWSGSTGKNPFSALGKHKRKGNLFAVTDGDRDFYPAFQFSDDAKPKPAIAKVLERVPEPARGWPLLSWFNAENVFLKNRKPLDVIDSDPEAVADAADRFFGRDD